METAKGDHSNYPLQAIPWFGARKMARALAAELQTVCTERDEARALVAELQEVRAQRDEARNQLERLGALSLIELEARRLALGQEIAEQTARLDREKAEAAAALNNAKKLLDDARQVVGELYRLRSSGERKWPINHPYSPKSDEQPTKHSATWCNLHMLGHVSSCWE